MKEKSETPLCAASILAFRRGYRFKKPASEARAFFILGPERGWECSQTAAAVITQLNGQRTLGEISKKLASLYQVPAEIILADMIEVLTPLLRRGIFQISAPDKGKSLND